LTVHYTLSQPYTVNEITILQHQLLLFYSTMKKVQLILAYSQRKKIEIKTFVRGWAKAVETE